MSEFETYKLLCDMIEILESVNTSSTNRVANIRRLIKQIDGKKTSVLNGGTIEENEITELQSFVDIIVAGNDIPTSTNVETTHEIEMFQIDASASNVHLEFNPNSSIPPEHGTIVQKLWKVGFNDETTGHVIFTDTSDPDFAALVNAQISTALTTAPTGSVEDLGITVQLSDVEAAMLTQDLSSVFTTFEKPGRTCRQLRDIDIENDPALTHLTSEQKTALIDAVTVLNDASGSEQIELAQAELQTAATNAGIFSTSLGPSPNLNYSDLKRFNLQKDETTVVSVTASIPVVSWGESILGIPLRDPSGNKNKANRKDSGHSYIVDMGGIDAVIRQGKPNPLPAHRYYNNGPNGATENEGALDRYMGGKCVGINTTDQEVEIETFLREKDGIVTLKVPAKSGLWKLDRSTFDGGNRHAYYTVFSASRAPPAGFMGVVLAPKQNRLGRGRGELASGETLANGQSGTGKTFNLQDASGAILDESGNEIPSGLKGVTSAFDGHGMHPADFLKFLQDNDFVKGTQYLTIPASATVETVEDVLIPAGQFIPQITQAVGTLMQFGNGIYIPDGGPARFQSGLIPFMPGTLAYTPEWHINFIVYNCGDVECDGETYSVENVAKDTSSESWLRSGFNPSLSGPGPNPANSKESKFSPAHPDTFEPVQMRCGIKGAHCEDYINKIPGAQHGEITLNMLPQLENENKIHFTEAPTGAKRGWVKFLVVNCPLPVVAQVNIVGQQTVQTATSTSSSSGNCVTCSCDRASTNISINGDLNPIWLDEDDEGNDNAIGTRTLNFKVGDNIKIRSTSGTMHGVAVRMDNMTVHTEIDNEKTLAEMQAEVLVELENTLTVNNKEDLENNIAVLADDLINFHGGIPISFTQKAAVNPVLFPDGVVIADFTINESASGLSGTVSCTVHGSAMSFRFNVCP